MKLKLLLRKVSTLQKKKKEEEKNRVFKFHFSPPSCGWMDQT